MPPNDPRDDPSLKPAGEGPEPSAELSRLAQSVFDPITERIDELRAEIQSGSYEVSAEVLADALINAHLKK